MHFGFVLINGLLLGLTGSFHCAAYCGAISSSLALTAPNQPKGRMIVARHLLAPHVGRVAMYVAFGMAAGATVNSVVFLTQFADLRVATVVLASGSLMWSAAAALGWISESRGPSQLIGRLVQQRVTAGRRSLLPLGIAWGCTPCGMVYAALLSASLTGSPTNGALFMLGFGIATLPPLLAVGVGQLSLQRHRYTGLGVRPFKRLAGGLLLLTAMANLIMTGSTPLAQICAGMR